MNAVWFLVSDHNECLLTLTTAMRVSPILVFEIIVAKKNVNGNEKDSNDNGFRT